ncbi:MAG: type IV pilus modification protein PilV [Salinisphaeraceae bacterium]|nr:type IV pilus modification protein PilV [Salinisphaeraceae bacterium]
MRYCKHHPRKQAGFTLLEVLIGIVVVSIGLLTVAALQVVTKKANYEAVQRTTASLLAYDLAERMRANTSQLNEYITAAGTSLGGSTITPEPTPVCNAANPCNPEQLANHDLWEWEQALDGATEVAAIAGVNTQTGGLVQPSGCVSGPVIGGTGLYTIAIARRGTTALSNPTVNNCGQASGKYGANDEFRRILVYQVFIAS